MGDSGPLRDALAYAPIIQSLSGLTSVIGYGGDEPLVGEVLSGHLQLHHRFAQH